MSFRANLSAVPDPEVGAWFRDALAGWDEYTAGAHVPGGYSAYTLIRYQHPVTSEWMPIPELLAALTHELEAHTTSPDDCFHAVWEGNGWLYMGSSAVLTRARRWPRVRPARPGLARMRRGWTLNADTPLPQLPNPRQSLPLDALDAPRFARTHRSYILLRGPVSEARNIGHYAGERLHSQCPDLLWPADRAWALGTDTDLTGVFIGGSLALQTALLASEVLLAEPMQWHDTIASLNISEW